MPEIVIPYTPRKWALRLHESFRRWAVIVLHRRAGKTTAILNHHQRAAIDNQWESRRLRALLPAVTESELTTLLRRRTYWHVMPTFHQAKMTGAWDTLKEISRPIPGVVHNEAELLCTYPNGNKVQLIGANNPDSLRGPGLSGLSLDEYSQIPANAFGEVLSKSLADHLGYCVFSGTIKGKDQLFETHAAALGDPDWFSLWQDVDVSLATEEGATITALRQAMEDDRKLVAKGVMTQAEFDQEWYLSPEAAIKGSFYADQIALLRKQNQICRVPYDPTIPVDTDWDLGIDAMAIWFTQRLRSGEIRVIDYHEDIGGGLEECIKALRGQSLAITPEEVATNARRARYTYGEHWGPHDIETREISSGQTRRAIARSLGLNFLVTPKLPVDDGITAARAIMQKCWFDSVHCDKGIEALIHYRKSYAAKLDQFTAKPVHDWASHGADAFRGFAIRYKLPGTENRPKVPAYRPASAYS